MVLLKDYKLLTHLTLQQTLVETHNEKHVSMRVRPVLKPMHCSVPCPMQMRCLVLGLLCAYQQ